MTGQSKSGLARLFIILANLYLLFILLWALIRLFLPDDWGWTFLLNTQTLYLFLPLPIVAVTNLWLRSRAIWIGSALALLLFLFLYGSLFLPRSSTQSDNSPSLTVMTYNLLGSNNNVEGVVEAIRASGADVIALGELNPEIAAAVGRELSGPYPYQALEPQSGVKGAGIISRYPIDPSQAELGGSNWLGEPQIVTVAFHDTAVSLVHFHAIPLITRDGLEAFNKSVQLREEQAQAVADFASQTEGPLIAFGDLNATDQNQAYAIIKAELEDAWRAAGLGFGHTFPGADSAGSSRPSFLGISAPMWLIRIDYIFHNDQWRTEEAWIGPWDGVSDHRPVVARLRFSG